MVSGVGIVLGLVTGLVVSVGLLNWEANDDPVKSFLNQHISYSNNKISTISIEFKDGAVLLNVHTSQIMSCDNVKELLDIGKLEIKNKTYIPQCLSVSDNLVQIKYVLDNSI